MGAFIVLALWVLFSAGTVGWVAKEKGRYWGNWVLYGVFLWPVALIHVSVAPAPKAVREDRAVATGKAKRCPHCAELIRPDANVCRYCGRDL